MPPRKIDDAWWVDFMFKGRRVRKKSPVDTKRGAESHERELRENLAGGKNLDGTDPSSPLFSEHLKDWLKTYPLVKGNRPSEIRSKECIARVHLGPAFGHLRLAEITEEVIDAFTADKLRGDPEADPPRRPLAPKTVHNILTVLARCLKSAAAKLPRVPTTNKPRVFMPDFDWLKADEVPLVLDAARDQDDRTMILFALDTGARAGELLALRWGDLDFHNRKVVFRHSSTRGMVGPTKSGKTRDVPMTGRLKDALNAYKHLRGPLVFCRDDGKPLRLGQLHEAIWRTCRKAGLREIRWHDLRHTFASHLVSAGVPLPQIQAWLGHSTITMVLRYAHMAPEQNADMIGVLEGRAVASAPALRPLRLVKE